MYMTAKYSTTLGYCCILILKYVGYILENLYKNSLKSQINFFRTTLSEHIILGKLIKELQSAIYEYFRFVLQIKS